MLVSPVGDEGPIGRNEALPRGVRALSFGTSADHPGELADRYAGRGRLSTPRRVLGTQARRTTTVPTQASDVIEAPFRVVSTDLPRRASPNRRRAAARIVLWNFALLAAIVALPILF